MNDMQITIDKSIKNKDLVVRTQYLKRFIKMYEESMGDNPSSDTLAAIQAIRLSGYIMGVSKFEFKD
jgi:hypothetical protein